MLSSFLDLTIDRIVRVPCFSWFPCFSKFSGAKNSAFSVNFSPYLAFYADFALFFLVFCQWPLTPLCIELRQWSCYTISVLPILVTFVINYSDLNPLTSLQSNENTFFSELLQDDGNIPRQFANVLMKDVDLAQFQAFSPTLYRILAEPNRVVRLRNCLGKDHQSINFQDLARAVYKVWIGK